MKLSVKLSLAVLAAFLFAAIFGEVQYRAARIRDVTPEYNRVDTSARYLPPSAEHWLGTDNLGRSVALRLVQGARIAFIVGVMTSGRILRRQNGLGRPVALRHCRLDARAVVHSRHFAGFRAGHTRNRHGRRAHDMGRRLPHDPCGGDQAPRPRIRSGGESLGLLQFQASIRFPSAVSTEVFISFLGIGIQGEPSWGVMINNARLRLWQGVWWEMASTTLCIFLLVLSFNHLADYLRDRLDPALRNER